MLKKVGIVLVVIILIFTLIGPIGAYRKTRANNLGSFGLIPSWENRFNVKRISLSNVNADSLPSSVDLSNMLPPVGNQGHQGSCVAWAVGYYYKTFMEHKEQNWNVSTNAHQFSPAFIYNQINGGSDDGSTFNDAFQLLEDKGCDTLKIFPYNDDDYTTQPTQDQLNLAIPFKINNYGNLFYGRYINADPPTTDWSWQGSALSDQDIANLKGILANQHNVFVVGIPVFDSWYRSNFGSSDYIHNIPADGGDTFEGYHAITIVGYDDNVHGGCFRMVNSWGSSWGDNGYTWITYDWFKQCAEEGWKMAEKSPDFTVKVTSPNGGESFNVGDKCTIKWESSDAGGGNAEFAKYADIYYVKDGTTHSIATNVNNTGSYDWTIPSAAQGSIKIRVEIMDDTYTKLAYDDSDNTFTVSSSATPSVTLTQPNGGETLTAGSTYTIKWISSNLPSGTTFALSYYDGSDWHTIATNLSQSITSYNWTVPNVNSNSCLVKIEAIDGNGNSIAQDQSDNPFSITPITSPTVSTNSASDITSTSATLNGNLTDMGGASSVTVYFQWGTSTSYGNTTTQQTKSSTGTFSANLSNLSPNTTYHYRAVATNSAGTSYGDDKTFTTSQIPDFTISASPSSRSVTQGSSTTYTITLTAQNGFNSSVSLSASGLPTGATASFNPQSVTPTGSSTLTISTSSSTPTGSHTITITASGGGKTHQTSVTLNVNQSVTPPSAPQNLTATAGDSQITLTWQAPSNNGGASITSYKIYRGTSSGNETYIDSVNGSTTSYTDTGLINGTTYYYKVSAVNSAGEGPKSNEKSATPQSASSRTISIPDTQSAPGSSVTIPINVNDADGIAGGDFTITFNSNILTATDVQLTSLTNGFLLVKNLNNAGEVRISLASTSGISDPNHTGGALVNITFTVSSSAQPGATTTLSFTKSDIKDENGNNIPSTSQNGTFTVKSSITSPTVSTNSASDITSTSATLNGNLTDMGGASSVTVYFQWGTSTSYGNTTTQQTKSSTGTFSANLSNLSPNTTYHYRAVATNSAGTSYGDDKTFTTLPPIPPTAPQNLNAMTGNNEVTLTWSPSTQGTYPINGYAIYRGTSAGGESDTPIATVDANTTTYTDTNVTNGTTYYYYVKAYDNQNPPNYSSPSNEVSATINTSLSITTTSLPDGTVGISYSATLQATGGTGSYTWSITSGNLPNGLSLNSSTGEISGTPTIANTYNFTVQVKDGDNNTATKDLSITIQSNGSDIGMHITSPSSGATITTSTFQVQGTFNNAQSGNFKLIVTVDNEPHTYNFTVNNSTTWGPITVNMADFPSMAVGNTYTATLQATTQNPSIPPLQTSIIAITWKPTNTSFPLHIPSGWSIISVPFETSPSTITSNTNIQYLFYWDGNFWQVPTTLQPGIGYLVDNTSSSTIDITLTGTPTASPFTEQSTGNWQVIGNPFTTTATLSSTSTITYLFYWNGNFWIPADKNNLQPGVGYLILTSSPGTLTFTKNP